MDSKQSVSNSSKFPNWPMGNGDICHELSETLLEQKQPIPTSVLTCMCDQSETCVIQLGKIISVTDQQDKFISNVVNFPYRYAGILLGITNSFATIPGMVGPVIAKNLTHNVSQFTVWVFFFFITLLLSSLNGNPLKSAAIKLYLAYTCKIRQALTCFPELFSHMRLGLANSALVR